VGWYARELGEDEELWRATALLHDFDYEMHPTLDKHPQDGAPILREEGYPEELIAAVLSHAEHLHMPRDTKLKQTLFACDELAGFVHACGLVRPDGIATLEPKSVKKKLKQPSFAAGVHREEVYRGAEELGVELDDHIRNVVAAMRPIASELAPRSPEAAWPSRSKPTRTPSGDFFSTTSNDAPASRYSSGTTVTLAPLSRPRSSSPRTAIGPARTGRFPLCGWPGPRPRGGSRSPQPRSPGTRVRRRRHRHLARSGGRLQAARRPRRATPLPRRARAEPGDLRHGAHDVRQSRPRGQRRRNPFTPLATAPDDLRARPGRLRLGRPAREPGRRGRLL